MAFVLARCSGKFAPLDLAPLLPNRAWPHSSSGPKRPDGSRDPRMIACCCIWLNVFNSAPGILKSVWCACCACIVLYVRQPGWSLQPSKLKCVEAHHIVLGNDYVVTIAVICAVRPLELHMSGCLQLWCAVRYLGAS